LDAVKYIEQLEDLGREVGEAIDLERHFGPFLQE
jgi:hypothetical protein